MRMIFCVILLIFPFSSDREGIAFRNVKVEGSKGNYLIIGETKLENGVFYYTVEDGHLEYIAEKQRRTWGKYLHWETFTIYIQIPEEKLPDNGSLILNLYEQDDGNLQKNRFAVTLDKFSK